MAYVVMHLRVHNMIPVWVWAPTGEESVTHFIELVIMAFVIIGLGISRHD